MIHYHGLPITPETAAFVALRAGHAFPSFSTHDGERVFVDKHQHVTAFAQDGSDYIARLITRPEHYCSMHEETPMPFGAFIRKKREEKQIQMNEFARQLEISPAYWSRIERDMEKPPKDELIRKAAEILGIDPDDAFVEASRLPPDMREDVASVVRIYRREVTEKK